MNTDLPYRKNRISFSILLMWDQLTRTDNAYRRLLLTAMPALTLTLTLNVTCDKRPGQVYVRSNVCVLFNIASYDENRGILRFTPSSVSPN